MADADQSNLTNLTVDLLSAYVANNTVEHSAIPDLIKSTHAALKVIDSPEPPAPEEPEHKPAVSVRQSLKSPDRIISLIDGKPYQTLKRHLARHDLTPAQYRERYGLPKTYPMVAPAYSESRREIAKKLGLGNRVKAAQAAADAPVETKAAQAPAEKATTSAPKKAAAPKAPKAVPAAATAPAPVKAKAAPKPKVPAEPKAPAEALSAPIPKPVEASAAVAETKVAPKARKAAVPKANAAPATAAAKPARAKRAAKPVEPAS